MIEAKNSPAPDFNLDTSRMTRKVRTLLEDAASISVR